MAGCASQPPKPTSPAPPTSPVVDPAEVAKFGTLPSDYREQIIAWLGRRGNILSRDQVTFDKPRHGVVQAPQGPQGLQSFYGWMVRVTIESITDPNAFPRHVIFMFGADGHFGDVTAALVQGFGFFLDAESVPPAALQVGATKQVFFKTFGVPLEKMRMPAQIRSRAQSETPADSSWFAWKTPRREPGPRGESPTTSADSATASGKKLKYLVAIFDADGKFVRHLWLDDPEAIK